MATRLLAALCVLLLAAGAAQAQQPVRLAAAFGAVTLRAPGAERFAAAASGTVMEEGASLRTGNAARAVLALPGARAALDAGGHLDLAKADGTALILTRGVLALEVREAPAAPIQVATPRGVAAFAGPGRFLVAAGDRAAPVQLVAVVGTAQLTGAAGPISAEAGQTAWIAADGSARIGASVAMPDLLAWLAGEAPPQPVLAAPAPPPPVQAPAPAPPAPSTTVIVQETQPLYVPVWPVVPPPHWAPRPPLPRPPHAVPPPPGGPPPAGTSSIFSTTPGFPRQPMR